MFSGVAGSERGAIKREAPENRTTLKLSVGRRPPMRSRISVLAVSSGKPCIEPDTSSTKMYSRGGIGAGVHRGGRLHHQQEEILVLALG